MARPLKKGMEYFPHDVDAVDDEKIEILRKLFGNDGYAFYFIILERIYRTNTGELLIDTELKKKILVAKVGVSLKKFDELLKTSLEYELFSPSCYNDRKALTSNGIMKRVKQVEGERDKWRKEKGKHTENIEKTTENQQKTDGKPELSADNKSKYNTTELNKNNVNTTDEKYPLINSLLPFLSFVKRPFTNISVLADSCEDTLQKLKSITGDNFQIIIEKQINYGTNRQALINSVNPVKDLTLIASKQIDYLISKQSSYNEQPKVSLRPKMSDETTEYYHSYCKKRYEDEGLEWKGEVYNGQ